GDGGVDADDAAAAVGERAARVAGVERGVGLDHVVDVPDSGAGAGWQRAAEGRDDAGGHGAAEPVRVSDRDDELADAQLLRVPELGGHEVARLRPQDGEVGERVGADDGVVELAAVDERGSPAAAPASDDVRGGEEEAVRRDDDRAAAAAAAQP